MRITVEYAVMKNVGALDVAEELDGASANDTTRVNTFATTTKLGTNGN